MKKYNDIFSKGKFFTQSLSPQSVAMNNMKAFVEKQFRKSNDNLKKDDELYVERKQLNSLHNYFSHSLLYLERLESVIKNINIMISDLNRSLMSFFENDVNLEIIKHVSYILNTFSDVREQITTHIANSKMAANNTLEKIKTLQNLLSRKKNLGASIEHYEKKIRKLQLVTTSNQKHLDKVIRNEAKLNMVKNDYLKYHDAIKKGFEVILENKTNKVLFDARKDLEILLCYFSLMNSVSLRLKDPLKELKFKYLDAKKPKLPIDYNFFLEEEDDMNIFKEKKAYSHTNSMHSMQSIQMSSGQSRDYNYNTSSATSINPFTRNTTSSIENKIPKKTVSYGEITESDAKKESIFYNIKSILGVNDKSSPAESTKAKSYSIQNIAPAFPQ